MDAEYCIKAIDDICDSHGDCSHCPFGQYNNTTSLSCGDFILQHPNLTQCMIVAEKDLGELYVVHRNFGIDFETYIQVCNDICFNYRQGHSDCEGCVLYNGFICNRLKIGSIEIIKNQLGKFRNININYDEVLDFLNS